MPYMMPIPKNERMQLIDNGKIKTCLEGFVQTKYIHQDVKWRHFRRWQDVIYLIDLGEVSKLGEKDPNSWVENEMSGLRDVTSMSENEDSF